jgi:hypothetical protein
MGVAADAAEDGAMEVVRYRWRQRVQGHQRARRWVLEDGGRESGLSATTPAARW